MNDHDNKWHASTCQCESCMKWCHDRIREKSSTGLSPHDALMMILGAYRASLRIEKMIGKGYDYQTFHTCVGNILYRTEEGFKDLSEENENAPKA